MTNFYQDKSRKKEKPKILSGRIKIISTDAAEINFKGIF